MLLIVLGAVGFFVMSSSLYSNPHSRDRAQQKKCSNNLKQIGLGMQMYFVDGTETRMPNDSGEISVTRKRGWHELFDLEAANLACPAKHHGPKFSYTIHRDAANGVEFSKIEGPATAVAGDSSLHEIGGKANILFGDGHVSSQNRAPNRILNPVKHP